MSGSGGRVTGMHTRRALVVLVVAAVLPIVAVSVAGAGEGDLDPTFGSAGKVVSDFGGDETAHGVAVQPDGRIVVAGTGCGGDFLVARYDADGSPDASFGTGGRTCVDVGAGTADLGERVLLGGGGNLLVAGTSDGQFALVRLDGDGNVDPTFGTGGRATYAFATAAQLRDAALTADGGVAMVGETASPGCPSAPTTPGQTVAIAVARTTADGTPAPGFGTGGRVVLGDANLVQRGLAVAAQPDGALVVAGRTSSCSRVTIDYLVLRLSTAGAPDPGFSAPNVLNEPGPDSAADVAVQPDGRVVVAIDTFVGPATSPAHDEAFTVVRYNPDGSPDDTFDGDGVATALFAGTNATPAAIALQGDDILVGGSLDGDFALARFNGDGSLDTAFDGDGTVVTDFGGVDALAALAVQADGKVVAGGQTGADVALARYGTSEPPTTTTSSTTAPVNAICVILDQVASVLAANPLLQPFVALVNALRPLFGCP